nr:adenosine/AMP deaminase [Bacteriovorax sp. HI3]
MFAKKEKIINEIKNALIDIISETNGITISDTLELLAYHPELKCNPLVEKSLQEFRKLIAGFHNNEVDISTILSHPFSEAFFGFFKEFPLSYHEEHIHLTGSLSAEFIYPRLKKLLDGPDKKLYEDKIKQVYGEDSIPVTSVGDVDRLIRLKEGEQFKTYLKILYLSKLILTTKEAHVEAAYHMASELYDKYNVGKIRLKFTLSRSTGISDEQIPGLENLTEDDVVLGLYEGFMKFKAEKPFFNFILSPSFRKESNFFDQNSYDSKKEHFDEQVVSILDILKKYPFLKEVLSEVDTVGDERELYRKKHFMEMKSGLRRLQYQGFRIRSHHGETWKILRLGVQAVDNALNIWHIDTLEHGLSLGINPNYYFHRLFQRIMEMNQNQKPLDPKSFEYDEIMDMEWQDEEVRDKIVKGEKLTQKEQIKFLKTKFHTAREIEHYQHDVLNRMINKKVSLVALPSSNLKLTGAFPDYKDHPFSWWEKKGVSLGIGTDNYITLSTNYIQELLILLYSNPTSLKITKLLMVATKETRRPYISHLLWEMRKTIRGSEGALHQRPSQE